VPTTTSWQTAEVANAFLDVRRAAIPYAQDHLELLRQLVRHFRPEPRRILDLGCGDGLLARVVLTEWPAAKAVLIDHSEPMLERARQAMAPFGDRVRLVHADLADPLAPHVGAADFDLVISGFAIHHLPDARKRSLYEEIHQLLTPGGLFVHLEHVASATPRLESLFDTLYVDNQARVTGRPREQVERDYFSRPDKADNKLTPLETQLAWLRAIGFGHVDCYFKWLELALFGGVKAQ
jgi:SAM-dependent methyltransferase